MGEVNDLYCSEPQDIGAHVEQMSSVFRTLNVCKMYVESIKTSLLEIGISGQMLKYVNAHRMRDSPYLLIKPTQSDFSA